MPDAFFQKKRKRTATSSSSTDAGGSNRAGPSRSKPSPSSSRMRKGGKNAAPASDSDDDDGPGGIDDMDLMHRYDNDANSDDEAEAAETPAEARVRLAKMYLQGLSSNGNAAASRSGDDFFESETPSFGLADAAQADRDNIAARLQKDVAEQSGRVHVFLSNRLAPPAADDSSTESNPPGSYDYAHSMLAVRGHRLTVTSAVASSDAKWLFTASKDGSIIRWRLRDGKMMRILPLRSKHLSDSGQALAPTSSGKSKSSGAARRRARFTSGNAKDTYLPVGEDEGHTDEVWSLSLSSDGEFLASGGKDKRVCIWRVSPSSNETFVKTLSGHKDAITAVSFRTGSQELYTASLDRTLKLYDVSQLSYIETLFGHQESVLSISSLSAETAVSAGGRDRTCRYWKIRDESQLVFRAGIRSKLRSVLEGGDLSKGEMSAPHEAHEGSVEVVAMIDNHHFVSGGDSGTISLWNLGKKKPIFSVPVAHGWDVKQSESEGEIRTARWVSALGALAWGDIFVSGSWDGWVRIWGLTSAGGQVKGFRELFALPVNGVINSVQVIQPPLNTVLVDPHSRLVYTTAVKADEYKRRSGLTSPSSSEPQAHSKGERLPRIKTTKENSPPILVLAVGQEHRFGRWLSDKSAKNGALVIPLRLNESPIPTTEVEAETMEGANGARFRLV